MEMTSSKQKDATRVSGANVRPLAGDWRTGKDKDKTREQAQAAWLAQLEEDRTGNTADADAPGHHPVGATSSANSVSADPFSRNKALGDPVPQVTRHI